ncbi:MAG: hypothetical protein D4R73_00455 [Deltaproteobacteria bacterium]|nr:MAG: hypothetical protein D4R73_00455 [Deltaproteobacteria bacterium]
MCSYPIAVNMQASRPLTILPSLSAGLPSRSQQPAGTVAAGIDIVTCLSCHRAHASAYPDILRWDYSTMIANGGSLSTGCFVCHTTKDDGI